MAKAVLKYDLEDVDDKMSHLRAVKSLDILLVLWDLDQELRGNIKYAPDEMSEDKYNTYQELRDSLHQKMIEYDVNFDNLMG